METESYRVFRLKPRIAAWAYSNADIYRRQCNKLTSLVTGFDTNANTFAASSIVVIRTFDGDERPANPRDGDVRNAAGVPRIPSREYHYDPV